MIFHAMFIGIACKHGDFVFVSFKWEYHGGFGNNKQEQT